MAKWCRRLSQCVFVAITVGGASAAVAAAAGPDDPVLPTTSADRFLGNVPSFAGGNPSPSFIYPTEAVSAGQASAQRSDSPSVSVIGESPAQSSRSSNGIHGGGTIQRRQITPTQIQKHQITSPWQ